MITNCLLDGKDIKTKDNSKQIGRLPDIVLSKAQCVKYPYWCYTSKKIVLTKCNQRASKGSMRHLLNESNYNSTSKRSWPQCVFKQRRATTKTSALLMTSQVDSDTGFDPRGVSHGSLFAISLKHIYGSSYSNSSKMTRLEFSNPSLEILIIAQNAS